MARKNRSLRLANRVADIKKLTDLLKPLREAAKVAEGRDILPARRKVETHEKAISILEARKKAGEPLKPIRKNARKEAPAAAAPEPEPVPEPKAKKPRKSPKAAAPEPKAKKPAKKAAK